MIEELQNVAAKEEGAICLSYIAYLPWYQGQLYETLNIT